MVSDRAAAPVTPGAGAPSASAADLGAEAPLARAVGLVLRVGVLLAAAITAAGGVVLLRAHGATVPGFADFTGPSATSTVTGAFRGAVHGDGAALIQTGLIVLVATPVARVVMLLVGFWRERRWLYVVLSAMVLSALAASLAQSR